MEALTEPSTHHMASGWIHVGTTLRRGHHEFRGKHILPDNELWPRPLRRDWRHIPGRRSNKDHQRATDWLDGLACMSGSRPAATATGNGKGLTRDL